MENIIFDRWIEIDGNHLGYLKIVRKINYEEMLILLFVKGKECSNQAEIKTIQLKTKGRIVTAENGTSVDFGTAYPFATPEGKVTITKQFMKAFLGWL